MKWTYDKERQKDILTHIKERYFRSAIKFPNGHLTHHGDCDVFRSIEVYGTSPCTCGFLHDLNMIESSIREKLHPKYYEELFLKDGPIVKRTPEEIKEAEALVEKVFGKTITPSNEEWKEVCADDWEVIEAVFGKEFKQRKEVEYTVQEG